MNIQSEKFNSLINNAFAEDFRDSLHSSAELAREVGVQEEEILDSKEKVDSFFLD